MDQQSHTGSSPHADPDHGPRTEATASLGRRAAARLVDGLVLALGASVVMGVLGLDRPATLAVDSHLRTALAGVVSAAVYLAYFAHFESGSRQTLGKKVLGIHVVGPAGGAVSLVQAVRRNVWVAFGAAAVVPGVGTVLGGIASLAAVVAIVVGVNGDREHRRGWHDRLAGGTRVTRT